MPIIFEKDWLDYPDAIIDTQTSNKSALILASKLRTMGVKNHSFFLALHNPNLQGIDPYDPNLTEKQMIAIGIEVKLNPWYYFREIARAPAISGTDSIPVEFNRANLALWWSFMNHITIILTQPRQTGKSFSMDHMSQYLLNFRCVNTQINLLTKDDKLRADNISRLKAMYEELPEFLNFKTREDANNTEELSIKRLGNSYKTHVPQASVKGANNVGRGMTTAILLVDEAPFQKNIDISLSAAVGAMGAAVDAAKRNGEPYGIVFTTTAGRKDEKEGAYVYGMIEASATWSESFYDVYDEIALQVLIKRNGRGNYRVYICFSHIQLGKDDAWLQEKITAVPMTADAINRDFFNIWTSGNSASPLPISVLERIARSEMDPLHQSIADTGTYVMRWYIAEDEIARYMASNDIIAGIDTSDAVGGDDISIVFTSVSSGAVVAAGTFNETNLITFAMFLVELLVKWPRLTMIIERRSSAATILDYLLLFLPGKGIDPFKRLFNWVVNDPLEYKERWGEATQHLRARSEDSYTRSKKYFGFATSGTGQTSRSELYSSTLLTAIRRNCDTIFDRRLGGQLRGLVTRNGRIDHAPGEHDDLVIGWLLTQWFLSKGKNLAHYGIDPSSILVQSAKMEPKTTEEQFADYMQLQVRQRINTLFELMSNEPNEYLQQRYEMELKQLDRQVVLRDGENFSLDMFLTALKEKRKLARPAARTQNPDHSIAKMMGYSDGRVNINRLPAGTRVL